MLTHAFLMRLESFTGLFYSTVAPVSPAVSGKIVICPQNKSNYLKMMLKGRNKEIFGGTRLLGAFSSKRSNQQLVLPHNFHR